MADHPCPYVEVIEGNAELRDAFDPHGLRQCIYAIKMCEVMDEGRIEVAHQLALHHLLEGCSAPDFLTQVTRLLVGLLPRKDRGRPGKSSPKHYKDILDAYNVLCATDYDYEPTNAEVEDLLKQNGVRISTGHIKKLLAEFRRERPENDRQTIYWAYIRLREETGSDPACDAVAARIVDWGHKITVGRIREELSQPPHIFQQKLAFYTELDGKLTNAFKDVAAGSTELRKQILGSPFMKGLSSYRLNKCYFIVTDSEGKLRLIGCIVTRTGTMQPDGHQLNPRRIR